MRSLLSLKLSSIEPLKEEHIEVADNLSKSLGNSEQISDNDDEYNESDSQLNEESFD